MGDVDVAVLNDVRISHLLWVDDLVLLSLYAECLQKMLDHLFDFGLEWGELLGCLCTLYTPMLSLINYILLKRRAV